MAFAILDTCVYIGHWEGVLKKTSLDDVRSKFIVRQSAVVLSELRRGARTEAAQRLVQNLRRLSKTSWAPTAEDWWEAGAIVREIGDARQWELRKRQEFQNDALIALSARRYGAAVVTVNRSDFAPLAERLQLRIFLVS